MSDGDDSLLQLVGRAVTPPTAGALGVAVSGGGDSTALLHLLHRWAEEVRVTLHAVSVDHGLREGSAEEAQAVARMCADLGVGHTTLRWAGWDGKGNLQDQARKARYRLMAGWACERGIDTIALGHTADDQAETFLMRLARGSGVDGLSGMRSSRRAHGVTWVRPLLTQARRTLREYLRRHGVEWTEDPSNVDARFDRVKARQALLALAPLGIDTDRINDAMSQLRTARSALETFAQEAARQVCRIDRGDVCIDRAGLTSLPDETQMRLFAHALMWVTSAAYRPRFDALCDTWADVLRDKRRTLHGCLITPGSTELRISREFRAVADLVCPPTTPWDRRWVLSGLAQKGHELRALGETGLALCPDWRQTGVPRASLLASPAVWDGEKLVAAPLAGLAQGWAAELLHGEESFYAEILSH